MRKAWEFHVEVFSVISPASRQGALLLPALSLAIIPFALPTVLHDLAENLLRMCLELFSVSKCFFFPEINLAAGAQQQFYRLRREAAARFREIREDILSAFRQSTYVAT